MRNISPWGKIIAIVSPSLTHIPSFFIPFAFCTSFLSSHVFISLLTRRVDIPFPHLSFLSFMLQAVVYTTVTD
jgi:hypothetical protein